MANFKDNKGREWTVEITVKTVRELYKELDIDIQDFLNKDTFEKISNDIVTLCDMLFIICADQAVTQKISSDDFGRSLCGDSIDEATRAFLEALVAFFPSQKRMIFRRAMEKYQAAQTRLFKVALENLESPEVNKQIEKIIQDASVSVSKLPQLPGSPPPGHTPSES